MDPVGIGGSLISYIKGGSIPPRRNKAGFGTPLIGGQFSGAENWGVEMRVLKVCTDKVWVLPAKRVYPYKHNLKVKRGVGQL